MLTPADLQRQTLRLYGELVSRRDSYGGQMVLAFGEGVSGSGLAAAVSIAGGTALVIDPDQAEVKAVFRQGGIDFVVNTLDEALRILKNEIRKHTPVSVGLIADIGATLAEMSERGVRPDVHVAIVSDEGSLTSPGAGGGRLELRPERRDGLLQPSKVAEQWLESRGWSEQRLGAATTAGVRALDAELLQMETLDPLRLQWIRRIGHYQRPSAEAGRIVWLAAAEAEHMEAVEDSGPLFYRSLCNSQNLRPEGLDAALCL